MSNLQVGGSLSASGQWVTDGTNNSILSLTNDTTGRVGIGIQSPGALLHVSGVDKELKFTDTAGVAKDLTIRIGNNSLGTGNPGLELDTTVVSGNAMGYLLLVGGSPVAAIDKNGKIGIGTTEPSELLHIKGTGSAEIKLESNSGSAYIRQSNNTLNFFNVAERLTILNNGNVGIGTPAPAHTLELKTTETDDGIYAYYGSNNYKAYSLACAEGMGNFASNLEMFPPTSGFANPLVKLQAHNTGGGTMSLRNSGGTTTVNIASDGNSFFNGGKVGIGTTSIAENVLLLEISKSVTSVYDAQNVNHAIKIHPIMTAHTIYYGLSAVTVAPLFDSAYGADTTKYCLNIAPDPSSNKQAIKGINIFIEGADNKSDAIFIHGTGDINGINCAVKRGIAIIGKGESNTQGDTPIGGYFETNENSHYALKTGTGIVQFEGSVGIGVTIPSVKLEVNGNIKTNQRLIIDYGSGGNRGNAPASAIGASGDKTGMIAWNSSYLFVCTSDYDGSTHVWKRVALSSY